MSGFEYRVIWQREGRPKRRELYQTLAGALRCVERQRTAREEITWLSEELGGEPVPEIVFGPVIESRAVGEWTP